MDSGRAISYRARSEYIRQKMSNERGASTAVATTCVIALVGLPGSGKSTLAREIQKSLQDVAVDIIEYDRVASSLTNAANTLEAWRTARRLSLDILREKLRFDKNEGDEGPQNSLILVDDNFFLRSMRKEVWQVCRNAVCATTESRRIHWGIVWVDLPLDECLNRNRKRPDSSRVPDSVVTNMEARLESPVSSKDAWEQTVLHVCGANHQNHNDTVSTVLAWLSDTVLKSSPPLDPPAPPVDPSILEEERRATRESRLHQCDQMMRKWVGMVAQQDRSAVQRANKARKELLKELRQQAYNDDVDELEINEIILPEAFRMRAELADIDLH